MWREPRPRSPPLPLRLTSPLSTSPLHIPSTDYYVYSFADYYNPANMNFGALRVVNDDLVKVRVHSLTSAAALKALPTLLPSNTDPSSPTAHTSCSPRRALGRTRIVTLRSSGEYRAREPRAP